MNGSTHGIGWGRRNYHPGMKAGDQTDYGLYNVLTLEYLSSRKDKNITSRPPKAFANVGKTSFKQLGGMGLHDDTNNTAASSSRCFG